MNANSRDAEAPMKEQSATSLSSPPQGRWLGTTPRGKQILGVNVGIDFGTSSTKVIFTDRSEQPKYVCYFDHGIEGYSPACLPSAVRITPDRRVYFGEEAERRAGGTILRSFKMCIGCSPPTNGICQNCPNPLVDMRRPCPFAIRHESRVSVAAGEVASWYLAYVIKEAETRVNKTYPDVTPKLTYQTAAPLSSLENYYESMHFKLAIQVAAKMARSIEQGMKIEDLHDLYSHKSQSGLTNPANSVTFVIPETTAALMSFLKSSSASDGLYALVDVGAGTTDMSFFRYYGGNRVISYYSSGVSKIGGDTIDLGILKCLEERLPIGQEERGPLLGRLRVAKQFGQPFMEHGACTVDSTVFLEVARKVAQAIFVEYGELWPKAYEKELGQRHWPFFTVHLCGGGSRIKSVFPDAFQRVPRKAKSIVDRVKPGRIEIPKYLRYDVDGKENLESVAYLMLVAHGVAFPHARIVESILSKQVEPLEKYVAPEEEPMWKYNEGRYDQ